MGSWSQDVRFAFRQLRKTPVFALTAIVTLGLGIGVNAAMFSVFDQVILRALPYSHQARLVSIQAAQSGHFSSFSLPDLRDYEARSHSLEGIAYYAFQLPTLGGTDTPEVLPQIVTTPNLLRVLGISPARGRDFSADDAHAGHNRVAILSDAVWKKYFHGDPSVLGRAVPINGDPYTVVGILPAGIFFPMGAKEEILSPLDSSEKTLQDRGSAALQPIALLRPGVTAQQAQAELDGIHRQLLHDYPKDENPDAIQVESYRDSITTGSRAALFALDWAVLAVWLIACANVAGLMLTRTNARRREVAIRNALGAPRHRITRQFLTESLLISFAGAMFGLGIAMLALRLLSHFLAGAVLFGSDIHINGEVLAFLLLASCVSAMLFGWAPAWHAANVPAQEGLREGTAAAGTSRRQAFWRDALVVSEIGLTLALLIAAGLMVRTLLSLRRADLGFATENVVTGSMYLPTHGLWWVNQNNDKSTAGMVQTFFDPLLEKLAHTPGVDAVGFTTVRPLMPQWHFVDSVEFKDRPKLARGRQPQAQVRATTAGYFPAMGIRLLAGRFFNSGDGPSAPITAVVNQAFVHDAFPGQNPLGHQFKINDKGPREWATIVGVVDNARQEAPGQPALPEIDLNLDQITPTDDLYPILVTFHMDLALRTHMPSSAMVNVIRHDVHALEPEIAVQDVQSMQQVVDDSLGGETLAARLLGIFGFAALLIAVAGIYGLLAYSVSQRTRELGVRLALGAQRNDILWLILRHALALLAIGTGIGLIVAWIARGLMHSWLYGAAGYDWATILLVVVLLALSGLAASYWPARRAARVNPVEALRTE